MRKHLLAYHRQILTNWRASPFSLKDEVVVCADMAGEIIQVGDLVTGWKVGDRVSSNFSPDYLYGIPAPEHAYNIDGALFDGVLTQYRAFSSHVCQFPLLA